MNQKINLLPFLLFTAAVLVLSSCQRLMEELVKSPEPYIENIVEGHEQIYSIQAILRLAPTTTSASSPTTIGLTT